MTKFTFKAKQIDELKENIKISSQRTFTQIQKNFFESIGADSLNLIIKKSIYKLLLKYQITENVKIKLIEQITEITKNSLKKLVPNLLQLAGVIEYDKQKTKFKFLKQLLEKHFKSKIKNKQIDFTKEIIKQQALENDDESYFLFEEPQVIQSTISRDKSTDSYSSAYLSQLLSNCSIEEIKKTSEDYSYPGITLMQQVAQQLPYMDYLQLKVKDISTQMNIFANYLNRELTLRNQPTQHGFTFYHCGQLTLKHFTSNNKTKEYRAQGQGNSKKVARDQCYRKLLEQIFLDLPSLYIQYIRYKTMKGISVNDK